MTPLRQPFIEDLQLRNRSPRTIACYVRHVANFAKHFGCSPEQLGAEQVRLYPLHLLEHKASGSAFNPCICPLRFLYGATLNRTDYLLRLPAGAGTKPR